MWMDSTAAEFDGFVNGCVGGNAVEVEKLKGAEAEREDNGFSKFLVRAGKEFLNACVEGDLPPQDPHYESGDKVAVFWIQSGGSGRVQEFITVAAALAHEREDLERDLTRRADSCGWACAGLLGGPAHCPSLSPLRT